MFSVAMEGQLLLHVVLNHLRPHDQTARHVQRHRQNDVGRQERLGQHDAANGAIVQRALEPLAGVRLRQVFRQTHHVTRQ